MVDSRDAQRVCMGMPTVTRTMTVGSSPEQVVKYLKDFANSEEWDPATQRCTRVGSGSIEVGTSWRNVSKVFGKTIELTYTLESSLTTPLSSSERTPRQPITTPSLSTPRAGALLCATART
ncbi:SRPBCC family protein [Mycobacterium attenuatum]|uniref:SRPBCC family protein n=1 Tax=Mycobacterium attenuatum TaxID=2341086 RepID=UPI001FCF19E2|nr:SRPBCC family protein [Mycobacterium attenuatum]